MLDDLLNDQLFAEVIDHHYSRSVYLASLGLHFFREEGEVKALKEVGVGLE